jgi:hypothetical protein
MGEAETQLPVMKRMMGGASGQFLLVHVDGTLAEPVTTTEAFPTLAAAIQKLQSQRRGHHRWQCILSSAWCQLSLAV